MYKKIMTPLDGSVLAEAALSYVVEFARNTDTEEVVLLSIVEEGTGQKLHVVEGYLRDHAIQMEKTWREGKTIMPKSRTVAINGPVGLVATMILRFAEDNETDLIIMSTHGRSGINRWLLGSIAEKVIRGADIPVLLVRASDSMPVMSPELKRILVPLDGSELAEQALPHVEGLGTSTAAEVILLYVEPPPEDGAGAQARSASSARTRHRKDMLTYMTSIASGLAGAGLKVEVVVSEGHPAQKIVEESEDRAVNLIAMTSHGRTGLARWAFGSVADQVLHSSSAPILLIRASAKGSVPRHLQGPLVYRCYNCGRTTSRENFTTLDRCGRCHYLLKTCGNCTHFEGAGCLLQLPYVSDVHPGQRCPQFQFRKTRLILR